VYSEVPSEEMYGLPYGQYAGLLSFAEDVAVVSVVFGG
jgi:hypothetical protein